MAVIYRREVNDRELIVYDHGYYIVIADDGTPTLYEVGEGPERLELVVERILRAHQRREETREGRQTSARSLRQQIEEQDRRLEAVREEVEAQQEAGARRAAGRSDRGTESRGYRRSGAPASQPIDPNTAPPSMRPAGPLGRPEQVFPAPTSGDQRRLNRLRRDLSARVRERLDGRTELYPNEVFAIAEIRDRNGRRAQRVFGVNGPHGHAEQDVFRQLRPHMANDRYRGGSITMIVTQEPCSPGEVPVRVSSCRLEIRRFSRRHRLYTQVYVPIDPDQLTRSANPSFRRYLRLNDRTGRGPLVGRLEHDVWDDRPSPPPQTSQRRGPRGGGSRATVPSGSTQDDLDAGRARGHLLSETDRALRASRAFARVLDAQTAVLGAVLQFADILDSINRASVLAREGEFPERAHLRAGAQAWLSRGVAAAREAERAVLAAEEDQLDHIQEMINEAFNRRNGQMSADITHRLIELEEALIMSRDRLEELMVGCENAARSFDVATRMYRQLTQVTVEGFTQAEYFVMWHSTHGIGDIYARAAHQYFYAMNDTRRHIEALEPIIDDAQLASNQLLLASASEQLRSGARAQSSR